MAGQDFPEVDQLTVSLGGAECQPPEAIKDVTRRVDEALYTTKAGRRNRMVVGSAEESREGS